MNLDKYSDRCLAPWRRVKPQSTVRLFCFPYGGGGARTFKTWEDNLPSFIEVCPIQLPGRDARSAEVAYTRLTLLIQDLASDLFPRYLDKSFAFFGHSLGALISFELARELRRVYHREPVHLFLSGRRAPQLPSVEDPIYELPEAEFRLKLGQLKNTRKEVLQNTELMDYLAPILRADYAVVQTYTYLDMPPLDCPITAFGGLQDTEDNEHQLQAWRAQTTNAFSLCMVPGDHFFIHTAQSLILRTIAQNLQGYNR